MAAFRMSPLAWREAFAACALACGLGLAGAAAGQEALRGSIAAAPRTGASVPLAREEEEGASLLRPSAADDAAAATEGAAGPLDDRVGAENIDAAVGEDLLDETVAAAETPAERAARRRREAEEDPFAPVGIAMGDVLVKPSLELRAGHDSNIDRSAGGSSATTGAVEAIVETETLWSRHAVTSFVRGTYAADDAHGGEDFPDAEAKVGGRLDATRDLVANGEIRGRLYRERSTSRDDGTTGVGNPLVGTYGATLGATQAFGRASLGLEGTVDGTVYGEGQEDGTDVDNEGRDNTVLAVRLRAGYEVTPALKPFVEARAEDRVYDGTTDGRERGSSAVEARAGVAVAPGGPLEGEASLGWRMAFPDDPLLDDYDAFVGDAAITWRATALTTLKFTASTTFDDTTLEGSPGVARHAVGLEVEHALRRWLTLTAGVGFEHSEVLEIGDTDDLLSFTGGIDWKLSRSLWVTVRALHERQTSNDPEDEYTASAMTVGLKLQR